MLKKKSNYLFVKTTVLVVLIISVFTGLFYLITFSSLFQVSALNIEGSHSDSQEKIRSFLVRQFIVDNGLLAFLGSNNTLFWFLGGEESFLDDKVFPSAGNVSVKADILKNEVNINVQEKDVFGVLCNNRGCFAFSESGVVFKKSPRVEGTLIPRINDPHDRPIFFGHGFLEREPFFNEIFDVTRKIEDLGMRISHVTLGDPAVREWELRISGGPVFYFSFDALPDNFGRVLEVLGRQVDFNSIDYADFRVEGRIYYQ